jgi:hypothetical protein
VGVGGPGLGVSFRKERELVWSCLVKCGGGVGPENTPNQDFRLKRVRYVDTSDSELGFGLSVAGTALSMQRMTRIKGWNEYSMY